MGREESEGGRERDERDVGKEREEEKEGMLGWEGRKGERKTRRKMTREEEGGMEKERERVE